MEQFLATETLIIELLLIVSLVAIAVRRLRVPYTVALVVVGLLITFQQPVQIDLTPELILALFVPPLIFEAAFHIEFQRLRENLIPILVLAIPGVLLTTVMVGVIVAVGANLSLTTALVFGALISATDPVAVVALFRALGAPKSLTVLMEGESLFNDGTAIVVFNLMSSRTVITRSCCTGDRCSRVQVQRRRSISIGDAVGCCSTRIAVTRSAVQRHERVEFSRRGAIRRARLAHAFNLAMLAQS
jgi:NhaP-type Na+/H+ or K+/H+ antiporter